MIDFKDQLPKILSTFEHLNPETTSEEEKLVLKKGELLIRELSVQDIELCFALKTVDYVQIRKLISEIESNLHQKAQLIFKWFPGLIVSRVRITVQNS